MFELIGGFEERRGLTHKPVPEPFEEPELWKPVDIWARKSVGLLPIRAALHPLLEVFP